MDDHAASNEVACGQHVVSSSHYSWPSQPRFATYRSFPNSSRCCVGTGPIHWPKFPEIICSPRETRRTFIYKREVVPLLLHDIVFSFNDSHVLHPSSFEVESRRNLNQKSDPTPEFEHERDEWEAALFACYVHFSNTPDYWRLSQNIFGAVDGEKQFFSKGYLL